MARYICGLLLESVSVYEEFYGRDTEGNGGVGTLAAVGREVIQLGLEFLWNYGWLSLVQFLLD